MRIRATRTADPRRQLAAALATIAALAPTPLPAQEQPAPPVVVSASEVHRLASRQVGDTFRIDVALPASYGEGNRRYPVVYALDADLMFATIVESARMAAFASEMPEVIVVGQGYPQPNPARVMARRTRDYTPTATKEMDAWLVTQRELAGELTSGGAPRFLRFLREELIPWVESRYRTSGPRVFVGDSFGGLFGLHALFAAPDTFDRWLIGSPAIWYDDEITLAAEEEFAKRHRDLEARVFFSVGFLEEIPGDAQSESSRMVSNTRKIHHRLEGRAYPSLTTEIVLFDGETHTSVVPAAVSRGLRWLLRD